MKISNTVAIWGVLLATPAMVSAQVVQRGSNPLAMCTQTYGITAYPAKNLGCFRKYQPLSCHCAPLATPLTTITTNGTIDPGDPGVNHEINQAFLESLKQLRSEARGVEKQILRKDVQLLERKLQLEGLPESSFEAP